MSLVDEVIARLKSRPAGLRCLDIVQALESLGYTVTPKKAPHHKVYGHSGTKNYSGGNFNCGHGKDPHVLPAYVRNVVAELSRAKDDLEGFLCKRS